MLSSPREACAQAQGEQRGPLTVRARGVRGPQRGGEGRELWPQRAVWCKGEGRGGVGEMLEVLVLKVRRTGHLPRGAAPRAAAILGSPKPSCRGSLWRDTVAHPGNVGCRGDGEG